MKVMYFEKNSTPGMTNNIEIENSIKKILIKLDFALPLKSISEEHF